MVLALAVRLWLWCEQGRAGVVYPGDQDEYYRGAIHLLLQGDYYDEGQWLRPPLTSLWLAGIFALVGVDIPLALLLQCVVSAGMVLLLAAIARSLFASQRAGVAAALLAAFFLPYASYASQLLSETLFIFTTAAALLIFEAARQRGMAWRWLLAGGVMWGLATLTRPVGLYAVPLLLLWAVAGAWWQGGMHHLSRIGRYAACSIPPLALLLGFVLVVAPWSVRNYAVYGDVVLVDTNGGVSFWLGNLLEPEERELQFVWNETLPDSAQRENAAMQRALQNIASDPMLFLVRMRYKTVSLWQLDIRLFAGNGPIGITLDERSLLFALASDVQYVALMLLAIVGVVLALPRERSLVLLGWPLYGTLLCAVSLGHPRLRLPLLITAFVYAALPLAHPRLVWVRLRQAGRLQRGALVGGMALFALLIFARVYIPFGQSMGWLAVAHLGGGEAAARRAIAAMPENYLPYTALGSLQRQAGDTAAALAAYEQAAARAPQNSLVQAQRLDLLRRMGADAEAQAAMGRIAAYGWDSNQLYRWAWERLPFAATLPLDMGTPAPGVMRGFYPVEWERGRSIRWSMERAAVRIAAPDTTTPFTATLLLRADAESTPVVLSYGGRQQTTLQVGTAWRRFEVVLPPVDGVLVLQTEAHVVSVQQPYPRGIAIGGVWVRE